MARLFGERVQIHCTLEIGPYSMDAYLSIFDQNGELEAFGPSDGTGKTLCTRWCLEF
jgi:hypothetical protein